MPKVWQIGSGDSGRKYSELFLQHDVMFCGPGAVGPYDSVLYRDGVADGRVTAAHLSRVRAFAKDVEAGDFVLLRSGRKLISLGVVADGGYCHNSTFDDIYGWDLQHTQRVMWQTQLHNIIEEIQATNPIFRERKQIPTFTTVSDPAVLQVVEPLFSLCSERALRELPIAPPPPMNLEEFGEALFARGLSFDSVAKAIDAIRKLRRLHDWYKESKLACHRPSEHEIVAHLILPLLSALGWSEQLLAVEWHKIDLAVFSGTPTNRDQCVLVCEAKAIGHGLQDVLAQAMNYAQRLDLRNCSRILLADGGRFYLYKRTSDNWGPAPIGYVNFTLLRSEHILPRNTSAVDTLIALTPARLGR